MDLHRHQGAGHAIARRLHLIELLPAVAAPLHQVVEDLLPHDLSLGHHLAGFLAGGVGRRRRIGLGLGPDAGRLGLGVGADPAGLVPDRLGVGLGGEAGLASDLLGPCLHRGRDLLGRRSDCLGVLVGLFDHRGGGFVGLAPHGGGVLVGLAPQPLDLGRDLRPQGRNLGVGFGPDRPRILVGPGAQPSGVLVGLLALLGQLGVGLGLVGVQLRGALVRLGLSTGRDLGGGGPCRVEDPHGLRSEQAGQRCLVEFGGRRRDGLGIGQLRPQRVDRGPELGDLVGRTAQIGLRDECITLGPQLGRHALQLLDPGLVLGVVGLRLGALGGFGGNAQRSVDLTGGVGQLPQVGAHLGGVVAPECGGEVAVRNRLGFQEGRDALTHGVESRRSRHHSTWQPSQ